MLDKLEEAVFAFILVSSIPILILIALISTPMFIVAALVVVTLGSLFWTDSEANWMPHDYNRNQSAYKPYKAPYRTPKAQKELEAKALPIDLTGYEPHAQVPRWGQKPIAVLSETLAKRKIKK